MNDREIQILLKLKDDMSKTLDGVEKNTEKSTNKMMGFFKVGLVGAIGTVGVALGKLAVDSVNFGVDAENAQRKLQAQLGVTEKEAEELGQVAQDVWANNFGQNITEVTESISIAERNMKDFVDAANMQGVVEDAYRLADAYNIGIGESTMAANTLMKEFGLTSDEAFDFITSGMQKGLNSSDDFLDSINEYAVQFSDSNSSASEFFSVMETGLAGGVLGTDKIADSFKEFTINLNDVGRTDAFRKLGIDQSRLATEVQNGTKSGTQAYMEMLEVIQAIEDPVARNTAATEIFGTMSEDTTMSILENLDATKTSLEDMMGSNDELNAQYDTLGALMQGTWRELIVEMQPAVDKFLEIASDVMPVLIEALGSLVSTIGALWDAFNSIINSPFVQRVLQEFEVIFDELIVGVEELSKFFSDNWGQIQDAVTRVIDFLRPFLETAMEFFINIFDSIVQGVKGALDILMGVVKVVISVLTGDFEGLKQGLYQIWEGIKGIIGGAINAVFAIVENVANQILNVITSIFGLAQTNVTEIWEGIKNGIGNAINGALEIVTGVVNEIKGTIESVIDSIEGVVNTARELPGKVGGFLDNLNPTTGSGFLSGVFQDGGIVGGNSFTGDNLVVGVNSGEMILNREQQANLFDMIQAGNTTNNNNSRNIDTVIINTNEGFNTFMQELAL